MVKKISGYTTLALLASLFVWFGQSPAHALDKDCGDFANQKDAQTYFLNKGGPSYDPDALDADSDGIACETLPCPCYYGTQTPGTGGGGKGGKGGKAVLRQKAKVIRVVDGDTVVVKLLPGSRRRVRLLGIDTPEMSGPACGAVQATKSMERMLPRGTRVRLTSDPTQPYKDRYNRLLRYIAKLSNGRDINRLQVARGWATVFVVNKPFQRVSSYRKAQRTANNQDRGTWSIC